ncbi:hypothetical protein FJV76_28535 [Mesorhizobium sp. WSM4303]|nr:hypothetical protein FJV77_28980 [Mesorhizobium sp. WSM4306]TRC96309.1 hypothetical protein FJV76_28535 [Mesorhizobium sp. WSM4303]
MRRSKTDGASSAPFEAPLSSHCLRIKLPEPCGPGSIALLRSGSQMHVAQKWSRFWDNDMHQTKSLAGRLTG